MRKIARIHVFHAVVFAAWAGFVCLSAHAKTVALWPMELDPVTGTFDGRDAVDPDGGLTLAAGNREGEAQGVGWNLPPNPEPEANLMFPAVSRTAVRGWRTSSAQGGWTMAANAAVQQYIWNTNSFTVEGWIRLETDANQFALTDKTWTIIVQSGAGSNNKNGGWILSWRGQTGPRYFQLTVPQDGSGGNSCDEKLGNTLTSAEEAALTNSWHHLALTHNVTSGASNNSTWTLYIDGTQFASKTKTVGKAFTIPAESYQGLFFGGRGGNSQRLNAAFDYWRVSDVALLPGEFLCDGAAGTLVPEATDVSTTTTVAYWPLCKKPDGTLDTADRVGTANLHGGFMPTDVGGQPITNAASVLVPDAACAFAGDPPNPTASLGDVGNVGSILGRHNDNAATCFEVPGLGAQLEPASGSFTVEGYLKPRRREKNQSQFIFTTRTGNDGWGLQLLEHSGAWRFAVMAQDVTANAYNPVGQSFVAFSGTDMTDWDDWKHVALVFDSAAGANGTGQWRVYIDDALAGSVDATAWTGNTGSSAFFIGGRRHTTDTNHHNFYGWIDCVRVSKAALAPTQFLCAANGQAATDVLAYWPLNMKNGSFDGRDMAGGYPLQSAHGIQYFPVAADGEPTVTNPDRSAAFDGNPAAQTGSALFRSDSERKGSSLETNDPAVTGLFKDHDYTFECWVNHAARTDSNWQCLFLTPRTVTRFGDWLQPNQIFSYKDGTGFQLEDQNHAGGANVFPNSDVLEIGKWTHVALTCERTTVDGAAKSLYTLYLDGSEVSTLTLDKKYSHNNVCLRIGGRPDNVNNSWAGQIAAVRISNAALNAAQLLCAAPEAPATPTPAQTIVYWPFDNAAGGAVLTPGYGPSGFDLRDKTDGGQSGSSAMASPRLLQNAVPFSRVNAGSVTLAENAYMRTRYLGDRLSSADSFTVEGWLMWDGATRGGEVTVCGLYDTTSDATGRCGWKLTVDDTGSQPVFGIYARCGKGFTPMAKGVFPDRPAKPREWQHVALTYDPKAGARGVWTLYVDGKMAGTVGNEWYDGTKPASASYFRFGRMIDSAATGFSGGLDMWRVASGALTPEELLYVLADGTLLILK